MVNDTFTFIQLWIEENPDVKNRIESTLNMVTNKLLTDTAIASVATPGEMMQKIALEYMRNETLLKEVANRKNLEVSNLDSTVYNTMNELDKTHAKQLQTVITKFDTKLRELKNELENGFRNPSFVQNEIKAAEQEYTETINELQYQHEVEKANKALDFSSKRQVLENKYSKFEQVRKFWD